MKIVTANAKEELSRVDPADRVLLLSHCLRPSQTCPAKYDKQGLACPEDCQVDCAIGRLRKTALSLGYKGVCISPGGRLALKFVQATNPHGIVAVACQKELEEGVNGVRELTGEDELPLPIVTVPLLRDDCVDTAVDEKLALEMIISGCPPRTRKRRER